MNRRVFLVAMGYVAFMGCASLKHGAQGNFGGEALQPIKIVSDPVGAWVYVLNDAQEVVAKSVTGEGGTIISLPKNGQYVVRVEKAGYRRYQQPMKRVVDPAVYANAAFPPAFFVDAALGQLHKLPDEIRIVLQKE